MGKGYVCLIRNGDLFKIGHTSNLERRLKQLQTCVLVQSLIADRSLNLEQELHKRFQGLAGLLQPKVSEIAISEACKSGNYDYFVLQIWKQIRKHSGNNTKDLVANPFVGRNGQLSAGNPQVGHQCVQRSHERSVQQ